MEQQPREVPAPPVDFLGRDQELAYLERAVEPRRPVVISPAEGDEGVGCTALARAFAARWSRGGPVLQWSIPLDGPRPHPALRRWAQALGIDIAGVADLEGLLDALVAPGVAREGTLLVVDGVREADLPAVRSVLSLRGPTTSVLVTAEEPGVATQFGAREVVLEPLLEDAANELLQHAARAAMPPLLAQAMLQTVGDLPLAIRLAGARLRTLRPDDSGSSWGARVDPARVEALGGPSGLARAFHDLARRMDPGLLAAFRACGALPHGAIQAEALAPYLGSDVPTAVRALAGLADLALVEPLGGGRYEVHPRLRTYAAHLGEEEGERSARQRVALARVLRGDGTPGEVVDAPEILDVVDAAVEAGSDDDVIALATRIGDGLSTWCEEAALALLGRAVEAAETTAHRAYARLRRRLDEVQARHSDAPFGELDLEPIASEAPPPPAPRAVPVEAPATPAPPPGLRAALRAALADREAQVDTLAAEVDDLMRVHGAQAMASRLADLVDDLGIARGWLEGAETLDALPEEALAATSADVLARAEAVGRLLTQVRSRLQLLQELTAAERARAKDAAPAGEETPAAIVDRVRALRDRARAALGALDPVPDLADDATSDLIGLHDEVSEAVIRARAALSSLESVATAASGLVARPDALAKALAKAQGLSDTCAHEVAAARHGQFALVSRMEELAPLAAAPPLPATLQPPRAPAAVQAPQAPPEVAILPAPELDPAEVEAMQAQVEAALAAEAREREIVARGLVERAARAEAWAAEVEALLRAEQDALERAEAEGERERRLAEAAATALAAHEAQALLDAATRTPPEAIALADRAVQVALGAAPERSPALDDLVRARAALLDAWARLGALVAPAHSAPEDLRVRAQAAQRLRDAMEREATALRAAALSAAGLASRVRPEPRPAKVPKVRPAPARPAPAALVQTPVRAPAEVPTAAGLARRALALLGEGRAAEAELAWREARGACRGEDAPVVALVGLVGARVLLAVGRPASASAVLEAARHADVPLEVVDRLEAALPAAPLAEDRWDHAMAASADAARRTRGVLRVR